MVQSIYRVVQPHPNIGSSSLTRASGDTSIGEVPTDFGTPPIEHWIWMFPTAAPGSTSRGRTR
jgi:hypothetical protein